MGMTLCMPAAGRWMRAAPAMVGTAALDWTLAMVGAEQEDLEGLLALRLSLHQARHAAQR